MFHLLQFNHFLLFKDLEGVVCLLDLVLDQHYTAKRPGAQSFDAIKVFELCSVLGGGGGGGGGGDE